MTIVFLMSPDSPAIAKSYQYASRALPKPNDGASLTAYHTLPVWDYQLVNAGEIRPEFGSNGSLLYFEYPRGGQTLYQFAWIGIGTIRGIDTLISADIRPPSQISQGAVEIISYERI